MKNVFLWLLLVFVGIFTVVGHAEIYTWVDAQGVRHYSDNARSGNAKRATLPGVQSMAGDPDALERLRSSQTSTESTNDGAPASRTPELVEPQPGATIRDAGGVVSVTVTIGGSSALRSGEQLTYYLDGSPIPQSPTDQTRLRLAKVPRGTHTLSAALLYQGRELRRTEPVTFYMKPPSAISPLNRDQGGDGNDSNRPPGATVAPPAGNSGGAPSAPRLNTTSSAAGAS